MVLHTPGRGMEHGLIAGPAGSGRTNNNLRVVLVEPVQARLFEVMVADPLNRNGLCNACALARNARTPAAFTIAKSLRRRYVPRTLQRHDHR